MADLAAVFRAMREIVEPCAAGLERKTDNGTELYLEKRLEGGKPLFFGAVQLKKNYVSYHLMPVYTDPDLLKAVSPELKKRMRGGRALTFMRSTWCCSANSLRSRERRSSALGELAPPDRRK